MTRPFRRLPMKVMHRGLERLAENEEPLDEAMVTSSFP